MSKTVQPKLPKTPGATADALYALRAQRLKLEAEAERLSKGETALKEHLFQLLPKLEATSISGKVATVSLERVVVPTLDKENEGWEQLLAFCRKRNAWDLLTRKVNSKAWRARVDAKETVPGVKAFVQYKVHCAKK